jgi:biopolymer transport protein ExbB
MQETLNLLNQGGWPMIPLGICSLVALTIIIERSFVLRTKRVIDTRLLQALENFRGEDSVQSTLKTCYSANGAFSGLIEEVINTRHLDHAQAIESMHAVGRTRTARLERGLTLLEIIAAVSPLIGLLGTVLGMVTVFDAITDEGLGNPQVLADGISKALITTVAGLCVAIPALAFHSIFMKRVDALAIEMQDRATSFIVKLNSYEEK